MINTDRVPTTANSLRLAIHYQLANEISNVSEAMAVGAPGHSATAAAGGRHKNIQGVDMNAFWRYSLNVAG
jgi:hypothetical protein